MPQPLNALFYFMPVQKRYYDYEGCNFILVTEEDGLITFSVFDDRMNTSKKIFDVKIEDDTAQELSRDIYHIVKNMKDGGKNE